MPLPAILRRALVSGSAASIASSAVLALRGEEELEDPAGPLNGPSQWVWGLDYCLTPERLTPGFQKRLSVSSLVLVYAAFALGLVAAGSAAREPGALPVPDRRR